MAAQTEPMACIMNAVKTAQPAPVDYVLLYGAGPIGLSFIRVLKVYGIRNLIAAAKGEKRVQEAYACGADVVVDVSRESVADVVKEHWPFKADLVIDAVGRGNVLEEAVHLVNPKGRIVLFGLDQNAAAAIPPAVLTLNEVKMEGVLGKDFPAALEILKNPELQLEKIITHRVSLENIHVGIELMKKRSLPCNRISTWNRRKTGIGADALIFDQFDIFILQQGTGNPLFFIALRKL